MGTTNLSGKGKIFFKNCNIFDGANKDLLRGRDVLVEKNLISTIVPTASETFDLTEDGVSLDCEGRTHMTGLIDAHWHLALAKHLSLVADPEKNSVVIMKDGVIYKNKINERPSLACLTGTLAY